MKVVEDSVNDENSVEFEKGPLSKLSSFVYNSIIVIQSPIATQGEGEEYTYCTLLVLTIIYSKEI